MFQEFTNTTWIDWLAVIASTIIVGPFFLRFYFLYTAPFLETALSWQQKSLLVTHRLKITQLRQYPLRLLYPFLMGLGVSVLNAYSDFSDGATRVLLFYSLMLLYVGVVTIVTHTTCSYLLRKMERNTP